MDLSRNATPSFELRAIRDPEEFSRFSRLLDIAFHVPDGGRFLDDFPVWDRLNQQADMKRIGLFVPAEPGKASVSLAVPPGAIPLGRLIGCGAARIAAMKISVKTSGKISGDGAIPVGIIGAVATHPDWRGLGVASQVVRYLVDWLDQRKLATSVLWGSEHRLYGRYGYSLLGKQWVVPLSKIRLLHPPAWNEIGEGWHPALFECLRHRASGLVLKDSDRAWMGAHKNVRWFWLGPKESPWAYAALGRGIDLPGMVHEWGGKPDALSGLLAAMALRFPEASLLGSPELMKGFDFQSGFEPKSEGLCLARGADIEPLWFWGLDGA